MNMSLIVICFVEIFVDSIKALSLKQEVQSKWQELCEGADPWKTTLLKKYAEPVIAEVPGEPPEGSDMYHGLIALNGLAAQFANPENQIETRSF
jgi:hypothetical protein